MAEVTRPDQDTMEKIAAFTMGRMAQNRRWYHSGASILAGLFWLAFVATLFLLMLDIAPVDRISGAAAVVFMVFGFICSVIKREL